MKRWRPPRPLILIPLLLLVGAVVNVGVAWVLVGAPASWTPQLRFDASDQDPTAHERWKRTARRWALPDWKTSFEFEYRGLGWTWAGGSAMEPDGDTWVASRLDAGWPIRSMAIVTRQPTNGETKTSWSFTPPPALLPGSEWFKDPRDRIPLVPLYAGFAINTLFYATILALPLTFFPIRYQLRARRGKCPNCGYNLAGLRGGRRAKQNADPAPCPECGMEVRPT